MRRKDEPEATKKKLSARDEQIDLPLEIEIQILLQYLNRMTNSIRAQFLPGLATFADIQQTPEHLRNAILALQTASTHHYLDPIRNKFILDIFCRFLKLSKLKAYLAEPHKRKPNRERSQEEKEGGSRGVPAFEPNILKQNESFDPLDSAINPNYENYLKMFRIFTDSHSNLDYRIRELNPSYSFFAPPRFFLKADELRQFQSGFSEKGNIMMLTFEGSKIAGRRSYAFTQGNNVYWCTKKSKTMAEVLAEISDEKEKEAKEKEAPKKKDANNNEEQKVEDNAREDGSRLNNNFRVAYKMIGHHGKVTSISMSADEFYLISAGTDRTIKLWCLRQKTLLAEYHGHLATIWSVSFNASGYFFLSGSADKSVKLWVTDDYSPQRVYCGHTEDVIKAEFMSNPDLMISSSDDKTVRIWNTFTTESILVFKVKDVVSNFTCSLSGRFLMTCDAVGRMNLYDLLEGVMLNEFVVPEKGSEDTADKNKNLKIHDMSFSFDEKEFACVSSRYILIYSFDKISEKASKNIYIEAGREDSELAVATKEVIYTGRESNLVYCAYVEKGVLVVGASVKKKE